MNDRFYEAGFVNSFVCNRACLVGRRQRCVLAALGSRCRWSELLSVPAISGTP